MTAKPTRACVFTLELEADSLVALIDALHCVALNFERHQASCLVSGGYSSGYTYTYKQSATPTHNEYIKQLNDYLAEVKSCAAN